MEYHTNPLRETIFIEMLLLLREKGTEKTALFELFKHPNQQKLTTKEVMNLFLQNDKLPFNFFHAYSFFLANYCLVNRTFDGRK